MRRTHDSEPGPAGGAEVREAAMEQRMFEMVMDRFDRMERRQDASEESRRLLHEKINHTERAMDLLRNEVQSLDKSLSSLTPTVQEFIMVKQQVAGAGRLGRALWWIGGLILTAAASVISYFAGRS
jgi:hypothetical protein